MFPPDTRHPGRLGDFAELLEGQGIEVQVLRGGPVKAVRLTDARTGKTGDADLGSGTLLVRLDQPAGCLARVLLDPHVPMETGFFQDEREYLEKGKGAGSTRPRPGRSSWAGACRPSGAAEPPGDWKPWAPTPRPQIQLLTDSFNSVIVDGDPDTSPRRWPNCCRRGDRADGGEAVHHGRQELPSGALVVRREGNVEGLEAVLEPGGDDSRRRAVSGEHLPVRGRP